MALATACARVLLLLACGAAAACCPIPVDTDVMLYPAAVFEVRDAAGRPVEGARILVQTESQPHARPDDPSIELVTDAEGRATLVERVEEQTAFPLMMHGVPAYSWHACVDHPALGATTELTPRLQWENPGPIAAVLRGEPGRCVATASRIGIERPPESTPKGQLPGNLPSDSGPATPAPAP